MIKNTKSNAKDYLLEYKTKKEISNWIKLLIQKIVDTNGKISDKDKEQIFIGLLKENNFESIKNNSTSQNEEVTEFQDKIKTTSINQQLTLQKITHKKGVNAIMTNQSIIFSSSCTILYGLNGTGKSGYFRIIHELAGGNKTKNILENIYKQGNGLEVDIDFLLNKKTRNTHKWQDRNKRGIAPFNQIKVFDSEYLPIFLNERENSVNIEPLGLNLFHIITSIIDEFKIRLEELAQQQKNQKPDLQFLIDLIHSENFKLFLQKDSLTKEENKQLDNSKTISSEEVAELVKLKQDCVSLEKNNTEDSKKVLSQEKKEIDDLKDYITNLKIYIEIFNKNISSSIIDYLGKKKKRDESVKQFEVLKNIPSQDTDEWQSFIESAKDYDIKIKQSVFDKSGKCIYCHQLLSEDAIKLIQAYSQYLGDQSQQKFKDADDNIEELKTKLDDLIIEYPFSENLKKMLNGINNKQKQTFKTLIDQILEKAKKHKKNLMNILENKILISEKYSLNLLLMDVKLAELSNIKQKNLDNLYQSESKKTQKIMDLKRKIYKLEDKQNISKWKTKIEDYFSRCQTMQNYSTASQAINTRGITELGSKAHDELLTDSIRKTFEDELKALGKDIEVNLEKTGAGKGTVRTRLKILGNDVRDILSDGEQKAVGLALFLAEIESQDNDYPIVFDDPVTSVDHEVADLLAKKLLKMSTERQIIIFTHNKLFYDSLVYWGNNLKDDNNNKSNHICKNYIQSGCNTKGNHVLTYRIDREAKDKTGRIFEAQNESCGYFINKAKIEMNRNYSLSCVADYLKSAIEHYIDEKILLKTGLMKDRLRGVNVPWENLKKIESKKENIKKLETYWKDLSNRGTHITQNSQQNPLKLEELNKIIEFLES